MPLRPKANGRGSALGGGNAALADIGHSQGGCLLSAMSGRSASFDQMTTQDLPLSILTSWGC
jgi:hypothetical protein